MAPAGQQHSPSTDTAKQREAMQKLAFLVGRWSGPATINRGPQPIHVTQNEEVQYKLDGLVLLIEGSSRDEAGKVVFSALATITFDDTAGSYRFRAYNEGHYLDTELSVPLNGFSWTYTAGPAHIVNAMHLTDKGEWAETTEMTMGTNPARRSVEMLLHHQP
jgi:hypothetical protein